MSAKNSDMNRLPACPHPRPSESLMGYGMRLADLNGYQSLIRLFSLVGHRTMPRDLSKLDHSRVAKLFAQPMDSILGLSYPRVSRGARQILGRDLPSFAVESNRPRICLECLAVDFEFKALWDLTLMVCCPEHGKYLLADCPECKNPLGWGRPRWNRCRCGCDLSAHPSPKAPEDLKLFSQCIQSMMASDTLGVDLKSLTGLDETMSADSLMILTSFLGYWSVNESHAPLGKMFQRASMIERGRGIMAALEILKGWPSAFYEFLDRVKGKDSYPDTTILMYRDFGRLFYNLMYVYRSPDLDFVREELKRYDAHRRDEYASEGLSSEEVEAIGFHGPAKGVSFSAAALKKMARVGGVSFLKLRPAGSLRKIEVTSRSKADLAKREAERLRYIDVVRLLGVRPPLARKLIDEGLLTSDQTTILDGRGNESFYKEEVEALLSELEKVAKPLADAEDKEKLFPISKAFHTYGRDGFSALRVLESVRSGEVSAYKEEGSFDLSKLHVCHRQLSKLVVETVIGEDRGFIDFASALETFELSKSELKTILSHDAVEHIFRPFGGRNYTLIKKSDLEAFMVDHVRSSDIEAVMDKSGRFVRKSLAAQGVQPVWIKIHGDTGIWYKRSDLNNWGLGH